MKVVDLHTAGAQISCVPLLYRAVGERNELGRIPSPPSPSNEHSTATSPSLEKEDTVEDYFCRVLYKPKLKQEVEIGDLGS